MRTRAAVAVQAGKPLEIMDVNLEGPKFGEVLVEIKATGICHTDEFTLPRDPRPRRRRHRPRSWPRRHKPKTRRSRDPPLHTRMPVMPFVLEPKNKPVHVHPRDPRPRPYAGWNDAFFDARWDADLALHGLLDLCEPDGSA